MNNSPFEIGQADPAARLMPPQGTHPAIVELKTGPQENVLMRFWKAAKTAGQAALVAAEAFPLTNEVPRALLFTGALAHSPTPLTGALAAGVPTAIIEGVSGLAAAGLLQSERSGRFIDLVNQKGRNLGIPMDRKLSPASKAFWTFMGGAPLGMWLEQRDDPTRTLEQNRRYALTTAAWQGGVLAVAGAGGVEIMRRVIENPVGGLAVGLGVAAVAGVSTWLKKKGSALMDRMRQRGAQERAENIDRYYGIYSRIVNEYGKDSPQHQGLTSADFETVLQDDRVITTKIRVEGQDAIFPQLSPVEHYEWLNADYYADKYPDAFASGQLLHFTDLPTVKPGRRVRERLRSLADEDGVLVFDYPSSDPEYPQRVQALLESLGIEGSDLEVIGTQTYFAGQLKLKREHDPDEPIRGFGESYSAMFADDEYDIPRFANGASYRPVIGDEEAGALRRFYDKAYEVLNDHPCNQGLNPERLYEMMVEQDWVTKIVNSRDGKIAALCLLTNRLDELSWVNEDYYRTRFPEKAAAGQIVWFPGLAADPDSPQRHNLQSMVGLMGELVDKGNNEVLVVFDCCDKNAGFLDKMLNALINRTPHASIDIQPIATQQYCAIRTSRKR